MSTDNLKKWKPILDNFFTPYELEQEILEMLADYIQNNLEVDPFSTLVGNGMGSVNPMNMYPPHKSGKTKEEIMETLTEFKIKLSQDVDIRTDIKNVYYNGSIKRIVYELSNGDIVYLETKPLVLRDPNYVKKSKNLFLSISDPTNPKVRRMKIEDIRSKL